MYTRLFPLVTALFIAVFAPPAAAQSRTVPPAKAIPQVGIVQNPDEFDGAGCRLQLPADYEKRNERHVFVSNAEDEAIVNIDGSDVRLNRVNFEGGTGNSRNRFVDHYRREELEVRVDLVVTKKCDPSNDNCEVTLFDAVITVTRGVGKRTVRTKGFCGI